ncbi:MipA/OmpV family protein [Morganella morganii]|uniref:MipA/OmpV family protein n=1 Tax=Morganella morganii TaxID=582 RepID=UPI003EBF50D4
MKRLRILCLTIIVAPLFTYAGNNDRWSVGVGSVAELYPYKGLGSDLTVVPVFNYNGDVFFVRGAMVGLYLWDTPVDTLAININYSPLHFKPRDSNDEKLKCLNNRRSTAMAGITYNYNAPWGILRTSVSADILNKNNGVIADASYSYMFSMNELTLTPGIGIGWKDKRFNNYYYGVSVNEAQKSGLENYDVGSGISPFIEFSASYNIYNNWNLFITGRYSKIDSDIRNSPMVDKSYSGFAFTGIIYSF